MTNLRIWIIIAWISLPTVMYGGYALLGLITRGNVLTPFQLILFRAGHAHAGVLLVMSLLYYFFLDLTTFPLATKEAACAILGAGILAQSGGLFLHMMVGQPNQPSIGTAMTKVGAVLLACAILFLAYALIVMP
jgi:hypothetical protein